MPSPEQAALARSHLPERKKRQPYRAVITQRGLAKMNEGKTGELARKREAAPKRGSVEFKKMMSEVAKKRPQVEIIKTYWKGRQQTDEHVFKRTGFHKHEQ